MNETEQVIIDKMIIHKVDHRNYDSPQLADLESPISEEVSSFLRQHIAGSLEHKFTRTAVFDNPVNTDFIFQDACDALLNNPEQFVSQSQSISNHLFKTILGDKRISPSDLVICTFMQGDLSSKWLAILKMDPKDGFVGERETTNGLIRYVLRRVPDVLPTGELQKCAFILPNNLRASRKYDLTVLDQQAARYGARRMVASFFIKDYLQCKVGLNKKDKTEVFVYGSHQWINQLEDNWMEEDVERFKQRITTSIQDNVVDLTDFAQAVISEPDDQEDYLQFMRDKEGLEELTFEPDPEARRRLAKYTWFEGDNGLQIRIETDAIGSNKTLDPGEPGKRDSTGLKIITIKTTNWKPKPKRGR